MKSEVEKPSFKANTTLPYLGRNYPTRVIRNQPKNSIEIVDGKFLVHVKSTGPSRSDNKKLYGNFLMEKAQDIFEDKAKRYSKKLGVVVNKIATMNLKNRWGSLTKSGVLNLNLNLVKAPENVIDYIILHELCHHGTFTSLLGPGAQVYARLS